MNSKEIAIIAIVLALTFALGTIPMQSVEGFWGIGSGYNGNFQTQDNSGNNAIGQQ